MNILRRLVSGQKRRFQDGPDGFDLDLAYICPRVIAMGLPAQGREVLYRNPMQEIARFLQTYHRGHAKVYNLCSEHKYGPEQLSVPVQHFPFDDHQTPALRVVQEFCADAAAWLAAHSENVVVVHCKAGKGRTGIMICCLLLYLHMNAPNLPNLASAAAVPAAAAAAQAAAAAAAAAGAAAAASPVADAAAHDAASGGNTPPASVAVDRHCDAVSTCSSGSPSSPSSSVASDGDMPSPVGGRCWHPWQLVPPLQLRHLAHPVKDILALYAERRTHDGNGVTIRSQRRYVGYFWAVLSHGPKPLGTLPNPHTVQLRQISITGLPQGTADSCVLYVEARPSGSSAASASRVYTRLAPRAANGGMAGLCMVPCNAPLVQDDSCKVSTGPQGDSLTFTMPAASMGLSLMQPNNSSNRSSTNTPTPAAATVAPSPATPSAACGLACSCLNGGSSCSCTMGHASAVVAPELPISVSQGVTAAAALACSTGHGSCAGDDSCDPAEQAGCCVVEGDVRIVVMRGSTRLFNTWFHTAFLPPGGCYTLTRAQLDKPSKTLPAQLRLTVRFVDILPRAEAEGAEPALVQQLWEPGLDEDVGQPGDSPPAGKKHQGLGNFADSPFRPAYSVLAAATSQATPDAQHHGSGRQSSPSGDGGRRQQHGSAQGKVLQQGRQPGNPGSKAQSQRQPSTDTAAAAAAAALKQTNAEGTAAAAASTQPQRRGCNRATAGAAAGPSAAACSTGRQDAASAPASPHSRKLRSSSSWKQHLPTISSISTSALLWGADAAEHNTPPTAGKAAGAADSPTDWFGSAKFSWDWDSLSPVEEKGQAGSAAKTSPDSTQQGASCKLGPHAGPAASRSSVEVPVNARQQRRGLLGGHHRRHSSSGGDCLNGIVLDLHAGRRSVDCGSNCRNAALAQLSNSAATIELPVIVKRPSGASSIVDALLDPHPAVPNATAAAGASQRFSPISQLRRGYSWGSSSWFASATASSSSSTTPCATAHRWQQQRMQQHPGINGRRPAGSTGAAAISGRARSTAHAGGHARVAASAPAGCTLEEAEVREDSFIADLDPLLHVNAFSSVPSAVLGDCDPLQGLLEALNWSTDMRRYGDGSGSCSWRPHKPRGSRSSTSSEPSSPRANKSGRGLLHVLSSPALQQAHSVPIPAPSAAMGAKPSKPHCSQPKRLSMGQSSSRSPSHVVGGARSDTSRLLDLEKWAEEADTEEGSSAGHTVQQPAAVSGVASNTTPNTAKPQLCLDCVFGLHTGPCPGTAAPTSAPVGEAAAAAAVAAPAKPSWSANAGNKASATGPGRSVSTMTPQHMAPVSAPATRARSAPVTGQASRQSCGAGAAATAAAFGCGRTAATAANHPVGAAVRQPGLVYAGVTECDDEALSRLMQAVRSQNSGEELLQGLLGPADGQSAASCAAQVPLLVQQWHQLEKAWQRSWWV